MAEETVGYVRLQWTCKQCGTINPGPQKACSGCGAPQPADQEFDLPAQQELVKDEAEIQRAQARPDVHCPYCGARNPAGAKTCTQCNGPLDEASKRKAGQVLGAAQFGPVADITCAACGATNSGAATKCSKCGSALSVPKAVATAVNQVVKERASISLVAIGAIALACLALAYGALMFVTQTREQVGVVHDVAWDVGVSVEALGPVSHQDWRDQVPSRSILGSCSRAIRRTSPSAVSGADKVCGTPYVKNQGSGYGKTVQDCEYRVYDDWCDYTIDAWHVIRTEKASGTDLNPQWPDLRLAANEREGTRSQQYRIVFMSNDQAHTYATNDLDLFRSFQLGSSWKLQVNKLGAIAETPKK
jgi:ribosomal protein L40E